MRQKTYQVLNNHKKIEQNHKTHLYRLKKVGRHKFVNAAAPESEKDKQKLINFGSLGCIYLSKKDWLKVFKYTGYRGDYFFTNSKVFGL